MSTKVVEHNLLSCQIDDVVQPGEELLDVSDGRAIIVTPSPLVLANLILKG